jgi:hypothetical protein
LFISFLVFLLVHFLIPLLALVLAPGRLVRSVGVFLIRVFNLYSILVVVIIIITSNIYLQVKSGASVLAVLLDRITDCLIKISIVLVPDQIRTSSSGSNVVPTPSSPLVSPSD